MIDLGSELAGYGDKPPQPSKARADGFIPNGTTVPLADLQASGFAQAPSWQWRLSAHTAQLAQQVLNNADSQMINGVISHQCDQSLPDWAKCPECPL